MSYFRDQEGIINRYLRERESWGEHLGYTKSFIASSFQDLEADTVAVLGSGWLLDVPMDHLLSRFKRIILADIAHPRQIRHKYRERKELEFVECDLSGGAIGQVWQISKTACDKAGRLEMIKEIRLEAPTELDAADACISVNLLNQLDILLVEFMEASFSLQHEELSGFRKKLQAFHLEWLGRKPGCLISDVREISRDKTGNETVIDNLYANLPEGIRKGKWTWNFDNSGSYRPGQQITMEVKAVEWA
jgi:hypothetical protein